MLISSTQLSISLCQEAHKRRQVYETESVLRKTVPACTINSIDELQEYGGRVSYVHCTCIYMYQHSIVNMYVHNTCTLYTVCTFHIYFYFSLIDVNFINTRGKM